MPLVSVWLIFVLLVASMGAFVALIERIGRLQVNRMLIFTGDQGREVDRRAVSSGRCTGRRQRPRRHRRARRP